MGASVSKEDEKSRHQSSPYRAATTVNSLFSSVTSLPRAQCDNSAPPPPPLPGAGDDSAPPPPPPSGDSIEEASMAFTSSIPNPGPYEQAAMEGKRLVSIDTFDGMRFDISKQLSPYMAVVHSFWLGTSMLPDGRNKSYSFITQIADEAGLLFTRIDFDRGSVDGRVHRAILGGLAMGKVQVGVSQEGQQDQLLAEVDFGHATWTGNLKYGSMGGGLIFGCNYFQSITPNLAMGGEGMYIMANNNLMSNYTMKYRMAAKGGEEDEEPPAGGEVPSSILCMNYNTGQDAVTMNYKRVVTPGRVSLGAELQFSPSTLQSEVLVGAEFKLTRSKVAFVVDGGMRIQSTVEAKLGMGAAPTLQFAGELDHLKNVLRFGYGLNIEG